MDTPCSCGIFGQADVYILLVISKDIPGGSDTTYIDHYLCADHEPADPVDLFDTDLTDKGWTVIDIEVHHLH